MQIASSMATKDFAGYFEQAVFQPALHSRNMCTKPRNMRTASRKITRGFDDYSEQAVFSLPFIAASCKKRPHFYVQAFL